MADYDLEVYRTTLFTIKESIKEMDAATDKLQFEHGPGGVSSRAAGYLNDLNTALRTVSIQQATILDIIHENTK